MSIFSSVLALQNNEICTLKGSLEKFAFLETLELGENQLRDLTKVIRHLSKLRFLKTLDLQVRPCTKPYAKHYPEPLFIKPGRKLLDIFEIPRSSLIRVRAEGFAQKYFAMF